MKKEELKILVDLLPYLKIDGEVTTQHLVYMPPSTQLRQAADALDAKEGAIIAFGKLVEELKQSIS